MLRSAPRAPGVPRGPQPHPASEPFVNLLQDGILHHLGIDHLLQFELVQRKNAHHLHQARSQDLALRDLQIQFGCSSAIKGLDSRFGLNVSVIGEKNAKVQNASFPRHRPGLGNIQSGNLSLEFFAPLP
jgi:hypothetical protein